jgi:hypothetical protein
MPDWDTGMGRMKITRGKRNTMSMHTLICRRTLAGIIALIALGAASPAICQTAPGGANPPPPAATPANAQPEYDDENAVAGEQEPDQIDVSYDFALGKPSRNEVDVDHRLVATYDHIGLLLEHSESSLLVPGSAIRFDSIALGASGSADDALLRLYFGIGATMVHGAENPHPTSVFFLVRRHIVGPLSGEFYTSIPLWDMLTNGNNSNSNNNSNNGQLSGAGQFEFALRMDWKYASLKAGYRYIQIIDVTRGGLFGGFALNF